MKQILFALFVLSTALISCSKQSTKHGAALPSDYDYYYQGERVYYEDEVPGFDYVLISDQLSEKPSYHIFDSYQAAKDFVFQNTQLSELKADIIHTERLRTYAESTNEDAYIAEHGTASDGFITYINQNKTRVHPYALFSNPGFAGVSCGVNIPLAALPVVAGIPMNNNAESIRNGAPGPINQSLFDLPGFNPAAGVVFVNVNNIANLAGIGWTNRASSAD